MHLVGYIGSIGFGGALILGGWDILVAKILSFVIGFGLIMPLSLVRDKMYVHGSSMLCLGTDLLMY